MLTGLVSNCWQTQLSAGESLPDLVSQATRHDFDAVELRQGCLGEFESRPELVPMPHKLKELGEHFPEMTFSLALSVPFLSSLNVNHRKLLEAGCAAAKALANHGTAHLRLVDLSSPFRFDVTRAAINLNALVNDLPLADGILSIEHSIQNWQLFLETFRNARGNQHSGRDRLKLCFDPCNLTLQQPDLDPVEITQALTPQEISMLHLKQCRNGTVLPDLSEGDVAWPEVLRAIQRIGYEGAFLLETAPCPDVWQHLRAGRQFMKQ